MANHIWGLLPNMGYYFISGGMMKCKKCGSDAHRDDVMNMRCNSCERLVRDCVCGEGSSHVDENPNWGTIEGGTVEGLPPRMFWGGQWIDGKPYVEDDGCDFRFKYLDKWWGFKIGKEDHDAGDNLRKTP